MNLADSSANRIPALTLQRLRQQPERATYYARLAVSLLALLGLILPWLRLDGAADGLSGTGLVAFGLVGDWAEKWWMLKRNWFGACCLCLLPFCISIATVWTIWREQRGKPTIGWPTTGATAALLILLTAADITASGQPSVGVLLMPGPGLALLILAHAGLAGHQTWQRIRNRQQQRRQTPAPEPDETPETPD